MQKNNNPTLIILAVCGGCVLLGIIAVVAGGAFLANKGKGMVSNLMAMEKNMPRFLTAMQTRHYEDAAAVVDPSMQKKINAASLQKMEESVEKKLGPMVSFPAQATSNATNQTIPKNGEMPEVDMVYGYTITYKKGTATATFHFKSKDAFHPNGLVTGFTLEPDTSGSGSN